MTGFFSGKAGYYAEYRREYPEAVFDAITDAFSLSPGSDILDLGCGTGKMALPLALRGFRVYAVDPEPDMLAEARRCEATAGVSCPVRWISGSDKSLNTIGLPPLAVCTMGLSFHWMDRSALLQTLDTLIEPGGGVVCVNRNDGFQAHVTDGWGGCVRSVLTEMLGDSWDYSGIVSKKDMKRHESIFAVSPFSNLTKYRFPVSEELTPDDIIGQVLSHSYINPVLLGERNAEFRDRVTRKLLKRDPEGRFRNESVVELIIAKRER